MHGTAKEQAEIAGEKDIVETSTIQAMGRNKYGNITESELRDSLKDIAGENKTEVIPDGDNLIVLFTESNRYYQVDKDGNIEEFTIYTDTTPGKLAGTGTEDNPFKIECIEDLVTFSIMTNGGNTDLGIKSSNFLNQYVALERTLDFNSNFSYDNYTTTKYGDLNTDGVIEDIKTELTKTDDGCIGFTGMKTFYGTFDGKENYIKNIYQNVSETKDVALFQLASKEIRNLRLSGTIINNKWHAAGICADGAVNINNCINYANITGYNMVGGISAWTKGNISNCKNYGTITITGISYQYGGAGGILGYASGGITIEDCLNEGKIVDTIGTINVAGIVGVSSSNNINNCINKGDAGAGIVSWARSGVLNIINCYNLGECNNGIISNFGGASNSSIMELNIKNCYNVGMASSAGILGSQETTCLELNLNIENCYNAGKSQYAIVGKITDSNQSGSPVTVTRSIKNTYYNVSNSTSAGAMTDGITALTEQEIKNNQNFIDLLNQNIGDNTDWNIWKIGEDGYPTFE